jgi:hypothetical protein
MIVRFEEAQHTKIEAASLNSNLPDMLRPGKLLEIVLRDGFQPFDQAENPRHFAGVRVG